MASIAQIDANRENAQASTGPVTEEGKTASSANALTHGLFSRRDFAKREERELYKEFWETMHSQLAPDGLVEESLTAEIIGANWRLRRCSLVEGELADYRTDDPLLDEKTEKNRKSIDRARAAAHSILHRSLNQFRKIQTDRFCREVVNANGHDAGLSDFKQVTDLCARSAKLTEIQSRQAAPALHSQLASICNEPAPIDEAAPTTPRNALCPCKSGQKYKRCCGKNAPPVLNTEAA